MLGVFLWHPATGARFQSMLHDCRENHAVRFIGYNIPTQKKSSQVLDNHRSVSVVYVCIMLQILPQTMKHLIPRYHCTLTTRDTGSESLKLVTSRGRFFVHIQCFARYTNWLFFLLFTLKLVQKEPLHSQCTACSELPCPYIKHNPMSKITTSRTDSTTCDI